MELILLSFGLMLTVAVGLFVFPAIRELNKKE